MTAWRRACRRHRPALLDLAEHGERGPATREALEHLDVCAACEEELVAIALTAAALRRAGAAYRRLPEPGPAATLPDVVRLRGEPRARPARLAWRLQLGTLATGAALAAIVVLPTAGHAPLTVPPDGSGSAPVVTVPAQVPGVNPWRAAEDRLASIPDTGPVAVVVVPAGTVPPRYPDTLFRPWKEVLPPDATARPLEPR